MGIFRRVGKLLTADVHGMLDLLEEPNDICKQAIREMEGEITQLRDVIQSQHTRLAHLQEQGGRVSERHAEISEQLALCIEKGDDALARSVMKRKLEQEKLCRFLQQQQHTLQSEVARDKKQLSEYEDRLTSIREKLACFQTQESTAQEVSTSFSGDSLTVTEEEIEIALLQAKSNATDKKTGSTI